MSILCRGDLSGEDVADNLVGVEVALDGAGKMRSNNSH